MGETYEQDSLTCRVNGEWCEINENGSYTYFGGVPEGTSARRALKMWLFSRASAEGRGAGHEIQDGKRDRRGSAAAGAGGR